MVNDPSSIFARAFIADSSSGGTSRVCETQLLRASGAVSGMYGDLQGIAGKTLQEIEGLEIRVLSSAEPEPQPAFSRKKSIGLA